MFDKNNDFSSSRAVLEKALISENEILAIEKATPLEQMILMNHMDAFVHDIGMLYHSVGIESAKRFTMALSGLVSLKLAGIEAHEQEKK